MFSAACKGKDGKKWSIHIPVDTWEDAKNIIDQLGLEVDENDWGLLIATGSADDMLEQFMPLEEYEAAMAQLELMDAIDRGEKIN